MIINLIIVVLVMKILLLLLVSMASAQAVARDSIKLAGPAAVVSYPLMVMAERQSLAHRDIHLSFTRWKNPDQLRAMILDGQADFSAMPSNLAAIFYNRGHKLTLLNISIWNIMWILSRDPQLTSLAQLAGREIVVPFKNDMPSIVLNKLLDANTDPKAAPVKLRSSQNLMDATHLLLAGQVEHALLVEPAASMALLRNRQQGKRPLYRQLGISELWRKSFAESPYLPQAGIVANTTVNRDKALVAEFHREYQAAANWCKGNATDCAAIVRRYLPKAPLPALIEAIEVTDLEARQASSVRADLERFYRLVAGKRQQRIGGRLPDEDFYL